MSENFDFAGWATINDLDCADGRVICKNAFKHCDGKKVPLVWNHDHTGPDAILGHAVLKNEDRGVRAYCKFNNTENGITAKELVNGHDVESLSICANGLKQSYNNNRRYVTHGDIREVSLVIAGANPGAIIDTVMQHGVELDDEARIYTGEPLTRESGEIPETVLEHSSEEKDDKKLNDDVKKSSEEKDDNNEKTIGDVYDTMNEEQKVVLHNLVGLALETENFDPDKKDDEDSKGGEDNMKHNIFDSDLTKNENVLKHSDEEAIIALAKQSNVGNLRTAMEIFADENDMMKHGFESYDALFPEYELVKKGEPETLERDQSWISAALSKMHKSPISRIRTRHADARAEELRGKGYQKRGDYKENMNKIKPITRTTDPQTIYVKDEIHRDDIIDITDFSVVDYQWKMMRHLLDEEIALAAMIGDGRSDGDPDKIHDDHIRPIWTDDDLYTIHQDVDITSAKSSLQGTDTSKNFSENYIYAEAIVMNALYAREKYKGSGSLDLYCTPHLLNVMLLARDLNGRRIYDSKTDLAAALNVSNIFTIEQFEGKTRTTSDSKTKKLLGLFVNLSDYQLGSTKGGEISRFEDFDMDFNRHKYLLETRLSGALIKPYSAIALEETVS